MSKEVFSRNKLARRRIKDEGVETGEHKDEIEALLTAIEVAASSILKSLENTIAITDTMTAHLKGHDEKAAP